MTRTHPQEQQQLRSQEQLPNYTFSLLLRRKTRLTPESRSRTVRDGPGRRFWVAELNWNRFVRDWEQPTGAGHGASLNALGRERSSFLGGSRLLAAVT